MPAAPAVPVALVPGTVVHATVVAYAPDENGDPGTETARWTQTVTVAAGDPDCEHPCGYITPGALGYPEHGTVDPAVRCDYCAVYPDDLTAAAVLAAATGGEARYLADAEGLTRPGGRPEVAHRTQPWVSPV